MKYLLIAFFLLAGCSVTGPDDLDKPVFKIVAVDTSECHYDAYYLSLDQGYDTEIQIKGTFETEWRPALSTDRDVVVIEKCNSEIFNFRIRYLAYGQKSEWSYYR